MNKCDKYHLYDKWMITYNPTTGEPIRHPHQVGVCWGTKEQDECSCEGNRCNCDFYEDVRETAKQQQLEEALPARIDDVVAKIYSLDMSGYIDDETKRSDIIAELLDIKTIIEKRNT